MPILDVFSFNDVIKPGKLRLRRNLTEVQIGTFRYASENAFHGAGIAISTELPIEEISRAYKWAKVSIPGSSPSRFIKLTENEILAFCSISF